MADPVYSVMDIVDKTLFTEKDLPYFDSYPTAYSTPKALGVFRAGTSAGQVYSWIDANPAQNRPGVWWMFYPGGLTGKYYFMPHGKGNFDMDALAQQGVLSDEQKRALEAEANKAWYEKILDKALPVIAITVLGAAAIRGYMSKRGNG